MLPRRVERRADRGGGVAIHDGVAMLAGASTDPAFRGRGAQAALLDVRLAYAESAGCDIAMMGALPGSASQRNGERQGFRIAYTRIKWQKNPGSTGMSTGTGRYTRSEQEWEPAGMERRAECGRKRRRL